MILADTSVWIDHFRLRSDDFYRHLEERNVLMHPLIVCELATGHLARRLKTLTTLDDLPRVRMADLDEVRGLIESRALFGRGIGAIDAHLLASALISQPCSLWTRDKRLRAVAVEVGLDAKLT